jgi:CubicO group peptidase (beta-lactamase class C family)
MCAFRRSLRYSSRGLFSMASQSVARSESIAAFIPALELLITEAMDEWKIPGLAVAVMQNGEVALVRAYGFAMSQPA